MKNLKKLASLVLALVMVFSLATTAFAADGNPSITLKDADNVSVAGKTFNAYKILDLQLVGTSYIYTVPTAMQSFYNGRYSLTGTEPDYAAQVTSKIANETDMFAFAKDALAAAKQADVVVVSATADANVTSVAIPVTDLGYYVIEDTGTATPISALMLDSTNPSVEITIKADKPSVDKKIDGDTDTDDTTSGKVEENNAAVGDKVPYVVTTNVPDMTGYESYSFVVTDTLSAGLAYDKSTAMTITVGGASLTENTDFTKTVTQNANGTTTVKIVFKNFIQYKTLNDDNADNDAIVITYSAIVDTDAVIGVDGNTNKVKLEYSNNPNQSGKGEDGEPLSTNPKGETPEEITTTYVTEVEIIKVDPSGNRLTGAEFEIKGTKLNTVIVEKEVFTVSGDGEYWKLTDGTYTTQDPNGTIDGVNVDDTKYASTTVKYAKETTKQNIVKATDVHYTGVVGSDGVLTFSGLSAGEYTITEIKAPDGYNLLKDAITVKIDWDDESTTGANCTWTYTWNGGTSSNGNVVTVTNQAGTELPSTGGMGTTLFYVFGGILVAAAVVLLVTKKRVAE